jgi:hypothetical protein
LHPNYKHIRHKTLCLLLPLIFASWCLPYKTPEAFSQYIWTPFSTEPLFHFGNILTASTLCSFETTPIFTGKNANEKSENGGSMTRYTP